MRRQAKGEAPPASPDASRGLAGEIQAELGVSASNLSHHLEKLKHQRVVNVKREGSFLRYTVNTGALQDLLAFLFSECCARTKAVKPDRIIRPYRLGDHHEHGKHN